MSEKTLNLSAPPTPDDLTLSIGDQGFGAVRLWGFALFNNQRYTCLELSMTIAVTEYVSKLSPMDGVRWRILTPNSPCE